MTLDALFTIIEEAQSWCLTAAGAQASRYMLPENRRDREANHHIKNSTGLLGVNTIHVNAAPSKSCGDGCANGGFCNFMEYSSRKGERVTFQKTCDRIRNRFALSIIICGEDDLFGMGSSFKKRLCCLGFFFEKSKAKFEIFFQADSVKIFLQSTNMTHCRYNLIV